ncbi:hypothetical protein ILYODFUR_034502 [Ilyodon furcidens]|uniref:BED-type domain-containing protein n=1 Tax=Ilyodon furcidens TaxID=33524 RepID=A0ABV0ULX9_9TELE
MYQLKVIVKKSLCLKEGHFFFFVWKDFGFKSSDTSPTMVICKLCRSKVVAAGGNTSNLQQHLCRKHVLEYEDVLKLKAVSSTSKHGNPSQNTQAKDLLQTLLAEVFPEAKQASCGWK